MAWKLMLLYIIRTLIETAGTLYMLQACMHDILLQNLEISECVLRKKILFGIHCCFHYSKSRN